jgi:GNAT superfamily N-acetyltransferase/NTP pyrophosphatase (non-canonical NTP hydrolase)
MEDATWETIDRLVAWLDRGSALPAQTKTILQILKITEEAGEVAQALIGVTGQNPRKGFSHSWTDVEKELCDVVITAMVALTRVNPDAARDVFRQHLAAVAARCAEQTDDVRIRIAGPQDAAGVLRMFDGIMEWLVAQGRTGQWGTQPWSTRPEIVELVTGRIERGELRVAEDDGEILGVVSVSEDCGEYVSPPPEPELFINLLGTSRAAKGREIGGLLLDEARAEARRRGLRLLRVDCYAGDDRKLNAWYVSRGFTEVGPFVVQREGRPDWPGMLLAQYLED